MIMMKTMINAKIPITSAMQATLSLLTLFLSAREQI